MKVSFVATVRTNFPSANFWLIRCHSKDVVGKPVRVFNKEYIGLKVTRLDIVIPNYLFYLLTHLHNKGVFAMLSRGTLNLVYITTEDVKELSISG